MLVLFPIPIGAKLSQASESSLALAQGFLGPLLRRDVLAGAAIALEHPLGIEHRFTADAGKADLPIRPTMRKHLVAKRTMRLEHGLMRCPVGGAQVNVLM